LNGEAHQNILDAFDRLSLTTDRQLQAVHEEWLDGCRSRLILSFAGESLILKAVEEDDTIEVSVAESMLPDSNFLAVSNEMAWKSLVGKEFGWGWATINQQGYCDGILLSFDNVVPRIVVNVSASSLDVFSIADFQLNGALVSPGVGTELEPTQRGWTSLEAQNSAKAK
jgi:hypothetical protein